MSQLSLDQRLDALAPLSEPMRRRLYLYVCSQGRPVSRDEAAAGIGVPQHVAKFHLDKLEADGFLDVEYRRPEGRGGPGAGRPTKWFTRSARTWEVSIPERHYEFAGRILAGSIDAALQTGEPIGQALRSSAQRAGEQLAANVEARLGEDSGPESAVTNALSDCGYEPRASEEGIVLANCPFHALAKEYTSLVCGINLDVLNTMVDRVPGVELVASLEPSPERCCVVMRPMKTSPL